jgi:hypothetical protein
VAGTVYSRRLYSIRGLAPGAADQFTCDANGTTIVRDIDFYASAGVSDAVCFVEGDKGQAFARAQVDAGSQTQVQWRGRQVFNQFDVVTINNVSASPYDVTISGYFLAD